MSATLIKLPRATMQDAAEEFATLGIPVFPCDPATKEPLIKHGFKAATLDFATIARLWGAHPNAMIGVPTGASSGLLVIDPDVKPEKGKDGIAELKKLIAVHGALPMTPTQRTPGGGLHILFKMPAGQHVPISQDRIAVGIDVRGDGGYICITPSVAATGNAYQWLPGQSLFEIPLADAPGWLLTMAAARPASSGGGSGRKPIGDPSLLASNLAMLGRAVDAMPNKLKDYGAAITMLAAMKGACGGDHAFFLQHVLPWSLKWSTNTAEWTEAKWNSIHDADLGRDFVYQSAREETKDLPPGQRFDEVEGLDVVADAPSVAVEGARGGFTEGNWLEKMNAQYFVAKEGGKVAICEMQYDPAMRRPVLVRQQERDFKLYLSNERLPGLKGTVAEEWIDHPMRRTFRTIAFLPGEEAPEDVYNLWRGFGVEPKAGDCTLFKALMRDIICNGSAECFTYLWNWMARAVQFPGEPGMVAPVLRSRKQRTGKGFFANHFGRLWGAHCMAVSQATHLIGRFNSHLENTCLLFLDEGALAGDETISGPLKNLISEKYITFEAKFFAARTALNRLKVIIASNSDVVIPADKSGQANRFLVLDVNEARVSDKPYFTAIETEMKSGGYAALLHELLATDISEFNVEHVPSTQALLEQQDAGLEDVASYLLGILHQGELPVRPAAEEGTIGGAGWDDGVLIEIGALHQDYLRWTREQRVASPKNVQQFGRWVERLLRSEMLTIVRPRQGTSSRRPQCYRLPSRAKCRAAFDRFLGTARTWPAEDA